MRRKIVTLYIDDTSLRLLVTDGKQVKRCASLALEPGLIEDGIVVKEAEAVTQIRQLLQGQKVRAKKVIVGLSGLHCLTRPITLPRLPKAMLDEAIEREAKRLLPIPFDQLYLVWQTIPAPPGKTQIFLAAMRRKPIDILIKVLRQAGLRPALMDIKPLVLAALSPEATAILVDVQSTEFDIVIMANGVPQPIRTVSFPRGALPWPERFPLIMKELDRTIKFYNSNNQEKPLDPAMPVFVSGELANDARLHSSLSNELGRPVLPLALPPKWAEKLDQSHMINVGLALKKLPARAKAGSMVANLNLLPVPYRPEPISWLRVLAAPTAVIVVGLFIIMLGNARGAAADMAALRSQFDAAARSLAQKQAQKQEIANNIARLEKELTLAKGLNSEYNLALGLLIDNHDTINTDLLAVTNAVPAMINLTGVRYGSNMLTVSGTSPDEIEVLNYAKTLDASGRFSETIVASMKKAPDGDVDFTLILKTKE